MSSSLLRMTNALGNYRYENFDRLTEEENLQIKILRRKQLEDTTELCTLSAVLVMDDIETSLQKIDTITSDTRTLYKKWNSVQKVLDRATSVLTLAPATYFQWACPKTNFGESNPASYVGLSILPLPSYTHLPSYNFSKYNFQKTT